ASIFMGQTEAPLTIRPFLPGMTRSELMTVMTAGMAHVSGSIMAAYIAFGIEARHLLTAVIMTAPGTIMMAKILEPETDTPQTLGGVRVDIPRTDVNVVDAAARGTTDGLHLMLNVIAMLVSFIALVALANGAFGWVHGYAAWFPENIQTVLGWVFSPIAWVMGVPWHDSGTIGSLLGTRMVLNEFIAYAQLGPMTPSRAGSARSSRASRSSWGRVWDRWPMRFNPQSAFRNPQFRAFPSPPLQATRESSSPARSRACLYWSRAAAFISMRATRPSWRRCRRACSPGSASAP